MLGPADDDDQLAIGEITECGQCLDVTLRHGGIWHGIDLLWLCYQEVGHDLCHYERRVAEEIQMCIRLILKEVKK